jgi:hypothetical protein
MLGPFPFKSSASFIILPFDAILCEYRQHREVTFLRKDDSRSCSLACTWEAGRSPHRRVGSSCFMEYYCVLVHVNHAISCFICGMALDTFQSGRYVRPTFKRFDTNAIEVTGFAGSFRLLGSETICLLGVTGPVVHAGREFVF